jgi:N-acetylglucosamine-6-phosphate deacetylase
MQTSAPAETTSSAAYLLFGTVVTDGSVLGDWAVSVRNDRIVYAGPRRDLNTDELLGAEVIPVPPDGFIIPGLVDLHCHGAVGGDFPAGEYAGSRAAVDFLHAHGTTTLLASLVTAPSADLLAAITTLKPMAAEGLVAGIHLEGPFLSRARCGAQNPQWLREPDLELLGELLRAAGGTLKSMTYAAELEGADKLVDMLAKHGVVPSFGHSDSDAETAAASLERAARKLASSGQHRPWARPTVTHLFNGMAPMHHRNPGPVAACLRLARAGTVAVELIGDGVHLDPQTVRMVFELVGPENVVLVTDSMAATGLPDGDYVLGPSAVSVRDGVATLRSTGSLAGGTATLLDVVRQTIAAGVSPGDAVASATSVPAQILGLGAEIGSLRTGMRADVVIVDEDFGLLSVLRGGARIPRKAPAPDEV